MAQIQILSAKVYGGNEQLRMNYTLNSPNSFAIIYAQYHYHPLQMESGSVCNTLLVGFVSHSWASHMANRFLVLNDLVQWNCI